MPWLITSLTTDLLIVLVGYYCLGYPYRNQEKRVHLWRPVPVASVQVCILYVRETLRNALLHVLSGITFSNLGHNFLLLKVES